MTEKLMSVTSYNRKVTLSKVTWSCRWCGSTFSDERFPGSYVPTLCESCRRPYRSWQRANYHRRNREEEMISLFDWVEQQKANGKSIPEISSEMEILAEGDSLGFTHAPAN